MTIPEQRTASATEYASENPAQLSDEEFAELYAKHYSQVVGLLRVHGAGDDAEDLAQQAFENAFTHMSSYIHVGLFRAWIHKIAMNLLFSRSRSAHFRHSEPVDDFESHPLQSSADPAEVVIDEIASAEALKPILDTVANGSDTRTTIFAALALGFTNTEISELFGINRSTVGTNIYRGRQALLAAGYGPVE